MTRTRSGWKVGIALVAASTMMAACSSGGGDDGAEDTTVKIGLINSLTGPAATVGLPAQDAYDALIAKAEKDGLSGFDIEVIQLDDRTDPTEASRAVTELVNEDVDVILGPLTGTAILAAAPVAAREEKPLIVYAGTQSITDPSDFFDWIFRAGPPDESLWAASIDHLAADEDIETVGIISEETAYGKDAVTGIEERLTGHGIEVVESVHAPADAVDVTAQVRKVRSAEPDAVIAAVSIGTLANSIAKAKEAMGFDVPLYGNSYLATTTFRDGAGSAATGAIGPAYMNLDDPSEKISSGIGALADEAGFELTGTGEILAANTWAVLEQALAAVDGEVDGASIRDAIESLCDIDAYTEGLGCFTDDDHDGWDETGLIVVRRGADGTLETIG
ncbi:ABC transporter substrate-binding protein [Aeromicrobium piscarium]|uniref:ABC transporter substrate-binding protein n=1 Tax=Aeromicrobium piscarium TaxID=2590901 RepID=A0A554SFP7_9ACTN|nr:ABC transporter substrate-binding protein [Aeromicrobium piscarium]TSD65146.1 ABC transporter substrate-binding protein [Aeromicrobium piscarium]